MIKFTLLLATTALLAAPAALAQTAEAPASAPQVAPAGPVVAAPVETPAPVEAATPVEAPTRVPAGRPGLIPAAAADGCELHVWPAERMAAQTTGWLSGFGVIGAIADQSANAKKNSDHQSLLATALDSPSQLDALASLDLRSLLARTPGTTIVMHETALERHTMNKIKARRSDSTAQCYSELIVADVLYQKAALYGRSLRTLFMFRDFGNDQKIDREYKAWGGNGLKLFPPQEGEDAVAALDELVGVFKGNFDEYSRNARKALAAPATRR